MLTASSLKVFMHINEKSIYHPCHLETTFQAAMLITISLAEVCNCITIHPALTGIYSVLTPEVPCRLY